MHLLQVNLKHVRRMQDLLLHVMAEEGASLAVVSESYDSRLAPSADDPSTAAIT